MSRREVDLPHIAVVLLMWLAAALQAIAGPVVSIEETAFELGDVSGETQIHRTVILRNAGNRDLWIERAYAKGQRIEVEVPQTAVAPGESVELAVRLKLDGLQGRFAQRLYLQTNAARTPLVGIEFVGHTPEPTPEPKPAPMPEPTANADGVPRLTVEPAEVDLGTVGGGKPRRTVLLRNDGSAPLVIKGIRASCGCTVPDLAVTTLEPGESTPMDLTVDTARKHGDFRVHVYVRSNDPETPMTVVRITGQRAGGE